MPELRDMDCKKYFWANKYNTKVGKIAIHAAARIGPS